MSRHRIRVLVLALAATVSTAACETPPGLEEEAPCEPPPGPAPVVPYELVHLPDSLLWYRGTGLQSFDDYPQDADGVILYLYNGRPHYNPVQVVQKGLWFVDNYRRTGDNRYLERSEAHARRLIADGEDIDGALFLPYRFAFRLHDRADQAMPVPWYSGMAQGQAVSLFLRLHEWTGKAEYRAAATGAMEALGRQYGEAEPWVTRLDCEGYYWIEEYPEPVSTRTLNGFIFGVWGAYEYWRATGSAEAERLVRASLATLKRYLPEYRDPPNPSYYCLKHRAQYGRYHGYHVEQLQYLYRLSGDLYFKTMADQFARDYPVDF